MKEVIQADFVFFDPKPDDLHGVKILLQSYLDDKEWDLSSFVELILAQTTVGSVVKIEDDEDDGLFGLVTALNLGRYKVIFVALCPFQLFGLYPCRTSPRNEDPLNCMIYQISLTLLAHVQYFSPILNNYNL